MSVDEDLAAALPVKVGDVIAGKYRVDALLAAGGMGAVFRAHHEILDKGVAIKLMRPELATHKQIAQRFLREARAAAKITSDYVARVTDVDLLNDKTPYMVMDLLVGDDLCTIMETTPRLPVAQAVDYAIEALFGLEAAHARGVVHRDLKPSNLFVEKLDGGGRRVKVLDFGISKVLGSDGDDGMKAGATTGAGQLLGTPRYMSPEQVASAKNVDSRTDLWSLGMILYEMLVGSYPFEGSSAGAILAKIVTAPIPAFRDVFPDATPELEAAMGRALAKERDERFATAGEMIAAFGPFASKRVRALITARAEHAGDVATVRTPAVPSNPPSNPTPTGKPVPVGSPTRVEGRNADVSTANTQLAPRAAVSSPTTESGVGSSARPSTAPSSGSSAPMFTVGLAVAIALGAGVYFFAFRTPSVPQSADKPAPTVAATGGSTAPVVSPGASVLVPTLLPGTSGAAVSPASASAAAAVSATSTPSAPTAMPVQTPVAVPVHTAPKPTAAPTNNGGLIRTRDG